MRPERDNCLSCSGTRLQTPTLIGCVLLKNRAVYCATDLRSVKRWDYGMFCNPTSSTRLFSTFAVLYLAIVAAKRIEDHEAYDYSSISGLSQQLHQESNLEALKRECGTSRPLRIVGDEHLRQCSAKPHRFGTQDGLLNDCNLPRMH